MQIITQTEFTELPLLHRGKVRDVYEVDDDRLLIVTTDRLSAFDVVMPDPIPYKGAVLNMLTLFWMEKFTSIVANHVLAADPIDFPEVVAPHADMLAQRSIVARKAKPLPIECIVRGFITGSGWKDYQSTGQVSGHALPTGLVESEMLPEPIFTPSTKADAGEHDENITRATARDLVGAEIFDKAQELSLAIYAAGRDYARERGILIADTKFEFGLTDDGLLLIDEVLTPDSSRFWPMQGYEPGASQPSFDKQFVRDYLQSIGFDKKPPGPKLPADIIARTRDKYLQCYELLTGCTLPVG
jgi:phosphoribosylaminoimidazole-succinocarboxamide synthase